MSQNSAPIAYIPPHLDRLLDEPYSDKASAQIDRWQWYCNLEGLKTFDRSLPKPQRKGGEV